jgi:DNA-binding HxlR family transcriptional regulator
MPTPPKSGAPLPPFARSDCPVACTLDLIGDKWTLLIVRDLFLGQTRYGEFLTSGEGIPSNILANRLRRLAETGLVEKIGSRPRVSYRLTARGRTLGPVLLAIKRWGSAQIRGTRGRSPRR